MPDKKKTILVTGCSAGGIGAAVVQQLAKHGHHVYATARNASKIPIEISELPNVTVLQLDVTSTESIKAAVKGISRLDVLVNNAGQGYTMPLLDVDIDHAQRLYDTNVWGVMRTVQAFAHLLIASQGRIVNISSVGAVVNTPWIGELRSSRPSGVADHCRQVHTPHPRPHLTLSPTPCVSSWRRSMLASLPLWWARWPHRSTLMSQKFGSPKRPDIPRSGVRSTAGRRGLRGLKAG